MKKSIDFAMDDHPKGGERPPASWAVAIADDCDGCDDIRVELTVEEEDRRGTGIISHMTPRSARRLRAALAEALRQLGEGVEEGK
jgi:hypothetical protein